MNRIQLLNFIFLKKIFEKFFGQHYPMELIKIIIMTFYSYKPILVGAGNTFTIISREKTYVFGGNGLGQLGLGSQIGKTVPHELELSNIEQISCGEAHTMVITTQKKIYTWGDDSIGQLGLGCLPNISSSPRKLKFEPFEKFGIKTIACGGRHTIALVETGEIYSWGSNQYGQLGLGDKNPNTRPQKIIISDITSISCGESHAVALTAKKEIYVWGSNKYGQLGTPKPHVNVWFSGVLFHISYGKFLSQRLKNARKNIENACIFICFCRAV